MTVSAITNSALNPAPQAPASNSVGELFSVPRTSDTTTTSPTSGAVTSSQAQSELQALLLQLQGGATLDSAPAAGTPPYSTSGANSTTQTDGTDPNDPNDPANQASSDSSVSAWLGQAMQAYTPMAGIAGGPLGAGLGLGASVLA